MFTVDGAWPLKTWPTQDLAHSRPGPLKTWPTQHLECSVGPVYKLRSAQRSYKVCKDIGIFGYSEFVITNLLFILLLNEGDKCANQGNLAIGI